MKDLHCSFWNVGQYLSVGVGEFGARNLLEFRLVTQFLTEKPSIFANLQCPYKLLNFTLPWLSAERTIAYSNLSQMVDGLRDSQKDK